MHFLQYKEFFELTRLLNCSSCIAAFDYVVRILSSIPVQSQINIDKSIPQNKMGQRLKKRKTETRDPDSTVLDISKYIDKIPESQKVKLRETDDSVSFILIDLRLPGNQVTYVSAGFESLTGYSRDEIIGKKL